MKPLTSWRPETLRRLSFAIWAVSWPVLWVALRALMDHRGGVSSLTSATALGLWAVLRTGEYRLRKLADKRSGRLEGR